LGKWYAREGDFKEEKGKMEALANLTEIERRREKSRVERKKSLLTGEEFGGDLQGEGGGKLSKNKI